MNTTEKLDRLTFVEEILLLMLDVNGRLPAARTDTVKYIVTAAALMELAFNNKIDTDPNRLFVVDRTPVGDETLDEVLQRVGEDQNKPMNTKAWIDALAWTHGEKIRDRGMGSLVSRGILTRRDEKFLRMFSSHRYATVDGRAEQEARLRITNVLLADDIPDPRDIALICLADACSLLVDLFSDEGFERVQSRIEQLRKMDLIGREVAGAIDEIERVMTTASAAHWHWY
ncbi:MAG: GPP34 family phosphoprotein [Parvularculales bacterium]